MKNRYLFPHRFKKIGWMLFVPAAIAGVLFALLDEIPFTTEFTTFAVYDDAVFGKITKFGFIKDNLYNELIASLLIIGGLLAAFSKEKNEDEYIAKLRLESLLWATYINYAFLLLSVLFIYGMGFYQVMIYNMFTLLVIFLIRFNFVLYRSAHSYA